MKNAKKLIILIAVLSCTISVVFADDLSTYSVLQTLVKSLSLLWIIPSIIAGKLMTNGFVSGELIGIDDYLFRFWKIMTVIANLGVGGVLIKLIIDGINESKLAEKLKGNIGVIIIGVLGIQLSRFGVTALIDLSNIAVAGVGGLINSYTSQEVGKEMRQILVNSDFSECIRHKQRDNNTIEGTREDCGLEKYEDKEKRVDDFIKNSVLENDSLTTPLMFMGLGIYRVSDFGTDPKATMSLKMGSMYMIVQLIIVFFTVAPLRILMSLNFIRVLYIRMRLATGPLMVLGRMLNQISGGKANIFKDYSEQFSIGNMVALIFQPVITVLGMGLVLIFTMAIYKSMLLGESVSKDQITDSPRQLIMEKIYRENTQGSNPTSQLSTDNGSFSLAGEIGKGKDIFGGGLGYILIMMFSIFIMWTVVKLTSEFAKLTEKVAKDSSERMQKRAKKTVKIGEEGKEIDLDLALQGLNANKPLGEIKNRLDRLGRDQSDEYTENLRDGAIGRLFGLDKNINISSNTSVGKKDDIKVNSKKLGELFSKDGKPNQDFDSIIKNSNPNEVQEYIKSLNAKGGPGDGLEEMLSSAVKIAKEKKDKVSFNLGAGQNYQVLKSWYEKGGKEYLAVMHKMPEIMELDFDDAMGKKGETTLGRVLNNLVPYKYEKATKFMANEKKESAIGKDVSLSADMLRKYDVREKK